MNPNGANTLNDELLDSIDSLVAHAAAIRDSSRRSVLGVAGPPGAGKSTLARALVDRLNQAGECTTTLLPMDGFHMYNADLDRLGRRNRKGAPDTFDVEAYVELLANVVKHPDEQWTAPDFSRVTDEPVPNGYRVEPDTRLVVTEGNYLLLPDGAWSKVKPLCAEIWFLDVDHDVERRRLIERQLTGGKSLEDATDWVDRSDLANAAVVRAHSRLGDRYIRLTDGALVR